MAQLQAELDRISGEVSEAAEAYNGAVYELGQVNERIENNTRSLIGTKRELDRMQVILERRLVQLYTQRDPTMAEILVTSGSISEMADRLELVQRLGTHDAAVVSRLRANREKLAELRAQLIEDRAAAAEQVKRRAAEKERIEALLAERERILQGANARLQRLIEEERERQRREAEAQAQLARQRAAALAAQQEAQQRSTAPQATPSEPSTSSPSSGDDTGSSSSGSSSSTPLPSGSGNAAAASVAMQQLGIPYRWGGSSPSTGFDCSGLASYAYAQIGKSVPHYTVAIYNQFPKVPAGSLQAGDLVFFRGLGHMGIYIGGGQYVHAPQTGDVVKVSSVSSRSDYVGAVRP